MQFLYLVVALVLLLVAMGLGAIVTLQAVRSTQADSQSLQQFSKDVASIAMSNLIATEREASRDRSLSEMAGVVEKLNVTTGNLFLLTRQMQGDGTLRSQHTRPMQHGEVPPGSPPARVSRDQPELPPEGFVEEKETPKGSTPAAEQTRDRAFAERT